MSDGLTVHALLIASGALECATLRCKHSLELVGVARRDVRLHILTIDSGGVSARPSHEGTRTAVSALEAAAAVLLERRT